MLAWIVLYCLAHEATPTVNLNKGKKMSIYQCSIELTENGKRKLVTLPVVAWDYERAANKFFELVKVIGRHADIEYHMETLRIALIAR